MRVIGWLADYSACGYYRLALPFTHLGEGYYVTDRGITDGDVIVGQRVVDDIPTGIFQRACADPGKLAVLELDDDLLHIDRSNPSHGFFTDPARRRNLLDNLAAADLVTVSTEPLAAVCREFTDRVAVLPNCVPASLLEQPRPVNERIVIGWAGSNTHSRDFGEVAKPLKRVLQRYGDRVEFHCLGTDYTHRVASIRGRTRHSTWASDVDDYHRRVDSDIALAPLFPSTFNASKSDLRLREMAALGVATIASDVGPYAAAIAEGCPAVPASSHRDWERVLCELIEDAEQRAQLGKQGREWAAQHTIETNAHRWHDTYRVLLSPGSSI